MYYNKVEICGVNTAKLVVLSDEEKVELLRRTKAGDAQARQDLVSQLHHEQVLQIRRSCTVRVNYGAIRIHAPKGLYE